LKNLEAGTLLIVEQPFASIDQRLNRDKTNYSMSFHGEEQNPASTTFYNEERFRLINEVEKQLLLGKTNSMTFNRLKDMQPIRQWIEDVSSSIKHQIPNQSSLLNEQDQTFDVS
jgi:hypothetical protein